ncbi:MAG: IS66 family insertion sequence element accessory protein TnpB [Bacillota bacterium]
MLNRGSSVQVYLATGSTDMRKAIDGLAAIVQMSFSLDPFSTSLFVFCNRSRNKLKILQWEHNGFWLYYKRLEKGRFHWPEENNSGPINIGQRELNWLLDGLELEQKHAHGKVTANTVI